MKAILVWQLVILLLIIFGYWNYRQACRSARNLMRLFMDNED